MTDFIVAFTLHASVILMGQTIIILLVVFAVFDVSASHELYICYYCGVQIEMEGNIFLYGLIVWITGILGECSNHGYQ